VVRLRTRVAVPRPFRRAGFSVFSALCTALGLAAGSAAPLAAAQVDLVVTDDEGAVAGASLRAGGPGGSVQHAVSDTAGRVRWSLASGTWTVDIRSLAHRPARRQIVVDTEPLQVRLRLTPLPLVMDEIVVRARADDDRRAPGIAVEQIDAGRERAPGADLPALLSQATGVDVRRYGGLGAFSSLSIRGSTSQQVLVYLDGVPLNSAMGGGVDLGALPAAGVESIDVYRGSVPGRFGGNSLGGVVHLRTRPPGGPPRLQAQLRLGAFGTQELSATLSGRRGAWEALLLASGSRSDNDFRFFDDNGTEYNLADDEWTRRRNSDYRGARLLARAARPLGSGRLQLSHIVDVVERGLPGIGNHQALHTRLDTRRSVTEAHLFGPLPRGLSAGRLKLYRSSERVEYRDLEGEVGVGVTHDRNRTHTVGARAEGSRVAVGALWTLFVDGQRERFEPRSLLRRDDLRNDDPLRSDRPAARSRRVAVSLGAEMQSTPLPRLTLLAGTQWQRVADDFARGEDDREKQTRRLASARLGATVDLGRGWQLRGHAGRYRRPPGFFELFGDRGAVRGNPDLVSESGLSRDLGLHRAGDGLVRLVELMAYHNDVDDMIRFVQNSQYVSRAQNLGRARLRGIESRLSGALGGRLSWLVGYTHQRAENRSAIGFEHGNDLPNSPRHQLRGRASLVVAGATLSWEGHRDSRSFLDRANLRPVPARTVHTVGLSLRPLPAVRLAAEVRNLTDNQVADLWGYPLPGRALFLSLDIDRSFTRTPQGS
jgi:outer membrane cobalamin receptor